MRGRREILIGLAAAACGGGALARPAQRAAPGDLTGVWTNAWYTKLERPRAFKALVVTPAEAEAFEAPRRAHKGELIDREHDPLGQGESEFPDNGPGLARIRGEIRSSWIVDPPDGRVPWIAGIKQRLKLDDDDNAGLADVEDRPTDERCLTTPGALAPLINAHDGNVLQIVQADGWLAIVGEKNHDVRIVRIGAGGPSADARLRSWTGDSAGRWEGATLVVETAGLRTGITKINDGLYLSDRARVVERFTRSAPGEIAYGFEVEDPGLFTRPWRAEMVFRPEPRGIFEYACHEGNYSLPTILAAARAAERDGAAAKGK